MAESPDLKKIGRYEIERILGEGAMGVVYEGKDTRLHRKVAIKTILKSALDSESAKEYSTRFAREAQAVARLNHANIVQVFDFAEARVTDPDRTVADRTQAGAVVGTPAYMSPEQIQGNPIDRRTDIFSAGVILYEFLSGTKPFTGTGAWTIAKKIIGEEPAAPSTLNPSVSPLFDAVVAKSLSKDATGRYQTAREFGFALKRAFEGLPQAGADVEKTGVLPKGFAGAPPPGGGGDATLLRTIAAVPGAAALATMPATKATELEFWRSIKDASDAADFDLYVQQFPSGIYAALAKRRR